MPLSSANSQSTKVSVNTMSTDSLSVPPLPNPWALVHPSRGTTVAVTRTLSSLILLCWLVSILSLMVRWRRASIVERAQLRWLGAGVLALGGLAALTVSRHVVWADPVALWQEAAFNAPRWDTYTALGHALRDAGECEAALVAYDVAVRIEPERLLPLVGRWACLTSLGRRDEALATIDRLRRADPELERLCREIQELAPHLLRARPCAHLLRQSRAGGPRELTHGYSAAAVFDAPSAFSSCSTVNPSKSGWPR